MKGVIRIGDIVGPGLGEDGDVALSAKRLEVDRIADEDIVIGDWVTATSGTNVALGQNNVAAKAVILGMALTDTLTGGTVKVLLFGNYESVLLAYALNIPLFLGINGKATIVAPIVGYQTNVARSNGAGSIFVKVEEPIAV